MAGETENEVTVAEAILYATEGFFAIAAAINRLADATAGVELEPSEEEMVFLDGKH